jgi:nucleoside phosphorylase
VTALHAIELEAVLTIDANWRNQKLDGDDVIYHRGEFVRDGRRVQVVAAAAIEMGMCAATALSMNLIAAFRPKYIAMVGIAAGVEGNFGDILVADQSWDYGSGKSVFEDSHGSRFLPAPNFIPIAPDVKYMLNEFAGRKKMLQKYAPTGPVMKLPAHWPRELDQWPRARLFCKIRKLLSR